jgi:hypothetical protein
MYTISILCCFSGFFILYNTSRKANLSTKGAFEKWLQQHPAAAKGVGILLIIASFVILVVKDGTGTGILTALLLLMTAGCLTVAIAPLYYLRLRHIVALTAGVFLLEFLFF